MSEPETQETAEIPAAVQLWDEVLQMRAEQQHFREEFDDHKRRVKDRHHALGEQLSLVVAAAERNTQAREDFEDEIKQLHAVMRQWYHSIIDTQKLLLLIAEHLEVERGGVLTLKPPVPLMSRAVGAKEAA